MIGKRLSAGLFLLGTASATVAGPVRPTTAGQVEGTEQGGVSVFRGIPYAAPPVGAARWRPPAPVPAWTGVRDATRFGHSCWQAVNPRGFGPWSHEYVVAGDTSEDCLFLNVWSPAHAARAPVLVWIHGGGFNSGSGAIPIYDGAALARRGLMVVTINYRVGVLGFLQHPDMGPEAGTGPVGNFGLQDMVAALNWVRANIAGFGGDPTRVTIAGQSAGGMAVTDLLTMPAARGLFARAIAQSALPPPLPTVADAARDGAGFARAKGAASLAALRALPPAALQAPDGANPLRFGPATDGRWLPAPGAPAADVPLLAGFTADEGSALGQDYGSDDPATLRAFLSHAFGVAAPRWLPLYPTATAEERARANRQAHRDEDLAALYRIAATRSAADGQAPIYGYLFTHVLPGPDSARWGAFHSSDVPYAFGTLAASPERPVDAADRRLSDTLACYWTAFAATGRPACPGRPTWMPLTPGDPRIMRLDDPSVTIPLLPLAKLAAARATTAP